MSHIRDEEGKFLQHLKTTEDLQLEAVYRDHPYISGKNYVMCNYKNNI